MKRLSLILLLLAPIALLAAPAPDVLHVPGVSMNGYTNILSDNGTLPTWNGTPLGVSGATNTGNWNASGTTNSTLAGLASVGGITNNGLTPSRLLMSDTNKKETSVSTTGLVDGTGSAVTVGSGLSFSGGTLSATGGGGGDTNWVASGTNSTHAGYLLLGQSPPTDALVNYGTNSNGYLWHSGSQSGVSTNPGFAMVQQSSTNPNGTVDEVLRIGANITPSGPPSNTNQWSMAMSMESWWQNATTNFNPELIFSLWNPSGAESRFSGYSMAINDTNNWTHTSYLSSDTWLYPQKNKTWYQLTPGSITWYPSTFGPSQTNYLQWTADASGGYFQLAPAVNTTLLYLSGFKNVYIPGGALQSSSWEPSVPIYVKQSKNFDMFNVSDTVTFEVAGGSGNVSIPSGASVSWSQSSAANDTKDVGLIRSAAGVLRVSNGSSGKGDLILNGVGSYSTNTTVVTAATGATNTLAVNVVLYVTAATGAALTDNAGTTEFSGVTIAAFTPIRLQPGGKFTGTSITYATGTASHAW